MMILVPCRNEIALSDDRKRVISDCYTINWSREELREYIQSLNARKERLDSPILPSSPSIFSF